MRKLWSEILYNQQHEFFTLANNKDHTHKEMPAAQRPLLPRDERPWTPHSISLTSTTAHMLYAVRNNGRLCSQGLLDVENPNFAQMQDRFYIVVDNGKSDFRIGLDTVEAHLGCYRAQCRETMKITNREVLQWGRQYKGLGRTLSL
jgi:hypothetical protein